MPSVGAVFTISIIIIFVIVVLFLQVLLRVPKAARTQQQQLAREGRPGLIVSPGRHADIIPRPSQAHVVVVVVGGRNLVAPTSALPIATDEIEQLPQYEAPPPQYERVVKAGERPIEMRDLERGQSSGVTAGHSVAPPGYQATENTSDGGGDERVSVRRVDSDGSHFGEPPPPPPPPPPAVILFVRKAFGRFSPFSR